MDIGVEDPVGWRFICVTLALAVGLGALTSSGCGGSTSQTDSLLIVPDDVSFLVRSRAGLPVGGATVYLIPASAVDTRPISAADVRDGTAEDRDEPLEDAVRLRGGTFLQAVTGADGRARITGMPAGRYFWLAVPGPGDVEHLPGGTSGRYARDHYVFAGTQVDLFLSSRPGDGATYLGSSTCLTCHAEQAVTARHAHKLALAQPGSFTAQQDASLYPQFADGWGGFVPAVAPEGGTAVHFADFDAGRGQDVFLASQADPSPGATVALRAWLWRDLGDGKAKITLRNVANPADPRNGAPGFTLEVPLTYGGAISKQAYLVRVPGRQGLYPLFQYHLAGIEGRFDATRRRYRDLDVSAFWDPALQLLKDPPLDATFEARCAACHFTGYEAFAGPGGERLARAVADPAGVLDIDGNAQRDELNVGCESCHGPGSEHATWAANAASAPYAGRYIVSPEDLSPSRQLLLCGRCHDRVVGAGTVPGEAPLDALDRMPAAGISRAAFLAQHVTVKGPAAQDLWSDGIHARTEHHQAADFLRSPKYRNDRILVTCQDCHATHGEATALHHLLFDHTDPASLLCFRCHNLDHLGHMQATTGSMHAGVGTVCSRCHMPSTARGGAGIPGFQFAPLTGTAADAGRIYYRNDRASHLFAPLPRTTHPDVTGVVPIDAMPIPYTDGCGTNCHDPSGLPVAPSVLLEALSVGAPPAR